MKYSGYYLRYTHTSIVLSLCYRFGTLDGAVRDEARSNELPPMIADDARRKRQRMRWWEGEGVRLQSSVSGTQTARRVL